MRDGIENKSVKLIKVLGTIIEEHRKKQEKSIYKISAESSIAKSTWNRAEIGAFKNMNITTFWKIAEGLDISPSKLMNELEEKLGQDFSLSDYD